MSKKVQLKVNKLEVRGGKWGVNGTKYNVKIEERKIKFL